MMCVGVCGFWASNIGLGPGTIGKQAFCSAPEALAGSGNLDVFLVALFLALHTSQLSGTLFFLEWQIFNTGA